MSRGAGPELIGFEPDDPRPPRRVNGWEIALWVIGVVLIGSSGALVYSFVTLVYENVRSQSPADAGFFSAFLQASSIFTPALVTGGIICIALAIFARASDVNATRRQAVRPAALATTARLSSVAAEAPEIVTTETSAPAPSAALAEPGAPAEPHDYRAFMRPKDG